MTDIAIEAATSKIIAGPSQRAYVSIATTFTCRSECLFLTSIQHDPIFGSWPYVPVISGTAAITTGTSSEDNVQHFKLLQILVEYRKTEYMKGHPHREKKFHPRRVDDQPSHGGTERIVPYPFFGILVVVNENDPAMPAPLQRPEKLTPELILLLGRSRYGEIANSSEDEDVKEDVAKATEDKSVYCDYKQQCLLV
ncbi:hypothetical protein EMCRGX_G004409 [Ephydatia muelleri]